MPDARRPSAYSGGMRLRISLILGVVAVSLVALPQLGLWGNPGCEFPGTTCTRVLFIGNSYTSVNDLPSTFARVAWAGGHRVETGALDNGGATLADHVGSPATATTIAGQSWNTVVLQDQSGGGGVAERAGAAAGSDALAGRRQSPYRRREVSRGVCFVCRSIQADPGRPELSRRSF